MIEFPPFHRRVLDAALDICQELGLYLAGGYAVKAHGLVDRPSQDLDLATDSLRPLSEVIDRVSRAYRDAGFGVEFVRGSARMGRIVISDPASGERCDLDFLKEPLQKKPATIGTMRVVALEDLAGMKATALSQRAMPRDYIDVAAFAGIFAFKEIERLATLRSDEDFRLRELVDRLEGISVIEPEEFGRYGLGKDEIRELYRFAVTWANEIKHRRAADGDAVADHDSDVAKALYDA